MIVFFFSSFSLVSLETTMNGNKMAKFLLLLIAVDLLLFSSTEGKPFWGRRRRRRCSSSRPGGVAWVNQWQQPFSSYCRSSKPVAVHINLDRERESLNDDPFLTLLSCKDPTHSLPKHVIHIPRSICCNF